MNALLIFLLLCLDYSQSQSLSSKEVDTMTRRRKVSDLNKERIVCYYSSWAVNRANESKFSPVDIDPYLCTHVIYAFATIEKDVGILPFDPKVDLGKEGYKQFAELKTFNPDLQLILSVGGLDEGSSRFSEIAADPSLRSSFAKNGRAYLEQFGFDGLNLDWQYPGFTEASTSSDKENYVLLIKEIKEVFKDDLGLSMVGPSMEKLIQGGYDLTELTKYIDFLNIVTYNYHEATEPTVNHVAPLYSIPDGKINTNLSVDYTIRMYMNLGVDPAKLNLGIPLYAVTYLLDDPEDNGIGASTLDEGKGHQGQSKHVRGAQVYNEFCLVIKEELWTIKHENKTAMGPYAYKDNRWLAYDDEDMVRNKASYAAEKNLGGLMFWSVDMDDFKGICHPRAYPLIKAAKETFLSKSLSRNSIYQSESRQFKESRPTASFPRPKATTSKPVSSPRPKPAVSQTTSSPRPKPAVSQTTSSPKPTPTTSKPVSSPRPKPEVSKTASSPRSLPPSNNPISVTTPTYVPPPPRTSLRVPVEDTSTTFAESLSDIPSTTDNYPELDGTKSFNSNRDIVFQNVKIWISNHFS